MRRWIIPILVAVAFSAGFAARAWTEGGTRALPLPPTPGTEFVRSSRAVTIETDVSGKPSVINRDKLIAEVNKVRPQIDMYRKRMEEIASQFDESFVGILTSDQRRHFDERQKKRAEKKARREAQEASVSLLTDQQIEELRRQPLWSALWNVAVNWPLDALTKEYKLSEEQRANLCELLKSRREQFLALVDSTPPPSITYSELARQAQKLSQSKD